MIVYRAKINTKAQTKRENAYTRFLKKKKFHLRYGDSDGYFLLGIFQLFQQLSSVVRATPPGGQLFCYAFLFNKGTIP